MMEKGGGRGLDRSVLTARLDDDDDDDDDDDIQCPQKLWHHFAGE